MVLIHITSLDYHILIQMKKYPVLLGEPHNRDSCPIYLHIWKGGAVMKCNDDGNVCQGKAY